VIVTLGIDTGDTAGFGLGGWLPGVRKARLARAYQCDRASAGGLLVMLILELKRQDGLALTAAEIEAFDDRPRSRGLHGTSPSAIRRQADELAGILAAHRVPVYTRTAGVMKPWARSTGRLAAAGLDGPVSASAMGHAADGMGHALFTAVHDCGLPDPLARGKTRAGAQGGSGGDDVPG
jgi:hypothetical protein